MKTPRQILLARHESSVPRLETVRAEVLQRLAGPVRQRTPEPGWWQTAWHELFLSLRPAWLGLTALGLCAVGLNLAVPADAPIPIRPRSPAPQFTEVVRERSQILADLADRGEAPTRPATRPEPPVAAPGPRRSSLDRTEWAA